jgi:pimeloyl-ACP methyl ester carboxylesterase
MSNEVLFIQGGGENVHDGWDDELVADLRRKLGSSFEIVYPRMPNEADPHFSAWRQEIERHFDGLGDGVIVIGHSIGGSMLAAILGERRLQKPPHVMILASAPFIGTGGWLSDEITRMDDLGARVAPDLMVHIFQGLADQTAPPAHADLYARAVPQAHVHKLPGRDHQLNNDMREIAHTVRSLSELR